MPSFYNGPQNGYTNNKYEERKQKNQNAKPKKKSNNYHYGEENKVRRAKHSDFANYRPNTQNNQYNTSKFQHVYNKLK